MGLKVLQIVGDREALAVECDDPAHGDEIRTAWFDCGSHSDNLTLAIVAGWGERRNNRTSIWLCPSCVRGHADRTHLEGTYVPRELNPGHRPTRPTELQLPSSESL
jgi:hypothetical protein